jgi:hypothetical protein
MWYNSKIRRFVRPGAVHPAGGRVAMRLTHITLASLCTLVVIVGCAKTEDSPVPAANAPSTQPTAVANPAAPATTEAIAAPPAEPTASMMEIARSPQWFPPARLRISSDKQGRIIARLYSDDPKSVLTGKETVNSYDMMMILPDISDPADISKTQYVFSSASMERQDTPYGIFLNNQQDILQPMNVTVGFEGQAPRVKVLVHGTFNLFHISEQNPNPAPTPVDVLGFLDAKVMEKK